MVYVQRLFMVNEPLVGKRLIEVTNTKTKKDWAVFIKKIADKMYPDAEKNTLVMDNFKTHSPSSLYETFTAGGSKKNLG